MPYFFVDGIRAGANAQSLYVQAENAEAAKTRAQALGLEPTGVRPAKSLLEPVTADSFRRCFLWMFALVNLSVLFLIVTEMIFFPGASPPAGSMCLNVYLVLPIVLVVAVQVYQLMLDRERMELELKELRQRLESHNPTV